jgi:hypothetical protein
MNVTRNAVGLGIIFSFAVSAAQGGFFPSDDFVPGWKSYPAEEIRNDRELFDYMDGGAELYLEYRFAELKVKEYYTDDGGSLTIEIYTYAEPQDAFGIFSADTTGTPVDIGEGGRRSGVMTRFWKGNYYIRTFVWEKKPEYQDIPEEAAKRVAEKLPESPALPDYLANLKRTRLQIAFVRGEIALRQVAGLSLPEGAAFDPALGACWIFPQSEGFSGALILFYSKTQNQVENSDTIWEKSTTGATNRVRVGSRGIAEKASGSFTLMDAYTGDRWSALIWVPEAANEAVPVKFIDQLKSALKGAQE